MYAILFDLDTNCLKECYGKTYNGAYQEVRNFMLENGFKWTQGSVYFGDETVDAVLTIQKFARQCPWFKTCVKDVRMLRIEDNNDLSPAIKD